MQKIWHFCIRNAADLTLLHFFFEIHHFAQSRSAARNFVAGLPFREEATRPTFLKRWRAEGISWSPSFDVVPPSRIAVVSDWSSSTQELRLQGCELLGHQPLLCPGACW
ncbi:unnamed protein product [Polarella glacialis]|uniref:Uncharacterized protein n=1 Tax=Polarella glacialis TaxID=89957 RepID=A0A813D927_POLGL|nr:unnamed protein product [Polarella glacialis]